MNTRIFGHCLTAAFVALLWVEAGYSEGLKPIGTRDSAYAQALAFTGFDRTRFQRAEDSLENVQRVTVTEDNTPFVHKALVDREVWRVTFDSVFLELPNSKWFPSVIANQKPKTWDIYLDPETGQLLKAETRYDGSDPNLSDEPPAAVSEKSMSEAQYATLVGEPPSVDLYTALGVAAFSSPPKAEQLIVILVEMEYRDLGVIPVWSILGRGVPPMDDTEKYGTVRPIWQLNRIRSLVSAADGSYLEADANGTGVAPPNQNKK